ncbi:MAG: hypothetical protein ACKVOX_18760, partial [Rhizobacter sp.]
MESKITVVWWDDASASDQVLLADAAANGIAGIEQVDAVLVQGFSLQRYNGPIDRLAGAVSNSAIWPVVFDVLAPIAMCDYLAV